MIMVRVRVRVMVMVMVITVFITVVVVGGIMTMVEHAVPCSWVSTPSPWW